MSLECSKCKKPMEPGFIVDNTYGGQLQSTWVDGPPVRSFWRGIDTRTRKKIKVMTFRCSICGYLESYAKE